MELANRDGAFVTLDENDFVRLVAAGIKTRWILNKDSAGNHYVRCFHRDAPSRPELVARRIVQAERGQLVRYRNGDRLDLRRANLVVLDRRPQPRRSKPDRLVIPPPPIADQPRPSGTMGTPEPTSGYAFAPL